MSQKSDKEKSAADSDTAVSQAQEGEDQPQEEQRLTIVGIGASAGGLAALQAFFDALPADSGMAFVVVTHMDPERESLLPELLQQRTPMPVRQVQKLVPVEANHVYVIPPNQRIIITDTHLDLERFEEPRGQRLPIDYFFRSLAHVHSDAVAIILSGGGTDGAVGVKAIKEQGGLLMVQHPDEAEHDSMPRAAIDTGLADVVLPVGQLAAKLVAYRRNGVRFPKDPEVLTADEVETVYRILSQVQVWIGHDFSQYKQSTILRRIQRRMQLHGYGSLVAYLSYLRHEEDEAKALFNDLLIGVTNFFRDGEAWASLAETVIPRLFEKKKPGETVRVWSIGCATGEEAYSLAILLMEYINKLERPSAARPRIQVFASDPDDNALNKAREGLYPAAIEADVSPERLDRYFVKEGHYYRVSREVRDSVLFSSHSVLRDPPFSRQDLISCRNLLIYLQREMQQNVFQIFHYALNPEGYLFLGSSESAEMVHQFFHTLDKTHRLYRARPWHREYREVPNLPLIMSGQVRQGTVPLPGPEQNPLREKGGRTLAFHLNMLETAAPPSVLVDETYHIIHTSKSAGRYLLHTGGMMTTDLLKEVRPELQVELRTALYQAFEANKHIVSHPILVQFNGASHYVTLAVKPYLSDNSEGETKPERLALVFFLEDERNRRVEERDLQLAESREQSVSQHETLVVQLENEVQRLRERLQATNEEYVSSNEELKAANEELQSINEEYRSTTEELETSKEELQSLNEEMQTVNAELKSKVEEISRAHSDLENLFAATEIATLFLDRELRIQRYTPQTVDLFNIMPADRGRPIDHLTHNLAYDTLVEDAREVLHSQVPMEQEVRDGAGRQLLARLRPYRTVNDHIDGIVLTLVDITRLKEAEQALLQEKEYSQKIVATVREGLLVLTPEGIVEFANDSFYQMFGVAKEKTVGSLIYNLGNSQWDIPELRKLLEEILPQANTFNDYRVEHTFEEVGRRVILLNARRLDHIERILLAIEDITERERYQQELQQLNETLEERVRLRTDQVRRLATELVTAEQSVRQRLAQTLHDDLQQVIYAIQVQVKFLGDGEVETELEELEEIVHHALELTRQLTMELSPPVLEGEGLNETLSWLVKQMSELYRLQVTVSVGDNLPLSEEGRILLYHIVRELLFNVVKHAGVTEALVVLQDEGSGCTITVSDQGQGFDLSTLSNEGNNRSFGLHSIHERLELFGGQATVESEPDVGTRITLFLPYRYPSEVAGQPSEVDGHPSEVDGDEGS